MKTLTIKLALLTIAFLGGLNLTHSQVITIGSGTNTNNYNEPSPVNITRDRSVSWTVYTVAELNAAGITGPATINRMGYFVTNIPVNVIPGYTISMKHTNAASAGNNPGNNGYTQVVDPFTYTAIQGDWDLHDLDTPFLWNGVQNIAVKVCWSTSNNDPSGQLRTYPAANGYRYRWTNNGNGSYCGSTPNANRQWKPQVRFVFETETIWTGAVSTDWFNALNWTAGVPDATIDTRIPVGTINTPNLTGTGECANFTLEGTMDLAASGRLNVYNDFINSGTYNDNGGETALVGTGLNTISNAATLDISNLIIESDLGGTITGSTITITEELQVNRSALNTNDLMILRSDESGTARIDELTTNCFYTLDMFDAWGDGWNGGLLTVLQDGVPVSTHQAFGSATSDVFPVANGTLLQLSYSSGIFENENTYTLSDPNGTQIFSDGPTPGTGIVFTTTASCGFTDPISGAISMERYIDAGETFWRYMGSAVQGADLAQFNDDFTTAGYPGSLYPNFPWISAYNYNETQGAGLGYNPTTGGSQVMGVGEGWQIWAGDTIIGTQPFTFDLVGVPNQGDIAMPVTYTNFGLPAEDGFNLVANPFASTIDWDAAAWTKTNMANATYIQNPDNQQYATYVAGASTNGGSRYIASQQAFWVQAFAASPVLTAREAVKSDEDQAFIKNGNQYSPGMTITLEGNSQFDEAVLRHVDGATDGFDFQWDAVKYWGGWGDYPQLSALNNEQKDLTVHSFEKAEEELHIPLRAIVFQDGMYNIKFNHVGEMDVQCMKLEDTYTGVMYDVFEGASYTFEMDDTTYAARFIVHIGRSYEKQTTDVSCLNGTDGSLEIDLDDFAAFDYELVSDGNSTFGNDFVNPLVIDGLQSGVYTLVVPGLLDMCGQTEFNFVVDAPAAFVSSADVVEETYGNDGSIDFTLVGGTAPYTYEWNTGDMSAFIGGLSSGTYVVQVEDDNGCEYTETFDLASFLSIEEGEEATLFYNMQSHAIHIEGLTTEDCLAFTLISTSGQKITDFNGVDQGPSQEFALPSNMANGTYIFYGDCGLQLKFNVHNK